VARDRGIQVLDLVPDETTAGLFTLTGEGDHSKAEDGAPFGSPDAIALVIHTSGTTSRPKIVPLTHANLCVSARNIAEVLALGPDDRCLNVVPLFHTHGLNGALLSTIAAGGSIVCPPSFQAPRFLQWLEDFQATWYTAVPAIHQAIARRAAALARAPLNTPLRLIRSNSAALPPQVMSELERLFDVPVLESYGMTEALQIASNPLPPGRRKAGSVGLPAGPEVAVLGADGAPLAPGRLGEIAIRGSNVTPGYLDPHANESAFVHGWFRTGDQGYRDEEGYIFLTGRLKELINRGGEKLAPREVDEALLAHPAVAEAAAFGVPDARLGESVAAAVVLRRGAQVTERHLREFLSMRLSFFKVPTRIVFVEELPKGPTGKLQRLGLGERLGLTTAAAAAAEPMTQFDAPVERVAELAAELLGVPYVDPSVSFLEAGGDSILGAQLIARLGEAFSVDVNLLDLFDARSLASLAATVADRVLSEIESMAGDAAVI
jgi:acyl-CoA synthetase (AMP-forming)/AMP-acid ligase II